MHKIYIKIIISLIPAIGLYFLGRSILNNDVQILGFISYYYFLWVLIITPLAYVFTQFRAFKKHSNTIITYRRPVGIIAGVFALLHMLKFDQKIYEMWAKFYAEEQSFLSFLFLSIFQSDGGDILGTNVFAFWSGTVGIILMFLLLVTSNNISQKIIGLWLWKRLQQLVYPLFIIVVIHIYFIGWWKWIYLYPAVLLFTLRFYSWFDKNFQYRGKAKISHSGYRRFLCPPCWFIYDEELWDIDGWLAPWTKYEEIPDDWVCPVCWAAKRDFIPLDGHFNPDEIQNHELIFTVQSHRFLTHDVIELALYSERDLEILPWQFCNLIFKVNGETQMRSYSVSQYRDNVLTFLIKLKDGGVAWEALKDIEIGNEIQWVGPFWNFVLQNTSRRKIFIASWTGLSPIYNMMHTSWESEKILYFWIRKQSDIFYLEELRRIPNLTLHIFLSREETDSYIFWRIEYNKIKYEKDDEIYMCWSPWLLEDLQTEFQKQGKDNIFLEKFL